MSGFTLPCLDFLSAPHLRETVQQSKVYQNVPCCYCSDRAWWINWWYFWSISHRVYNISVYCMYALLNTDIVLHSKEHLVLIVNMLDAGVQLGRSIFRITWLAGCRWTWVLIRWIHGTFVTFTSRILYDECGSLFSDSRHQQFTQHAALLGHSLETPKQWFTVLPTALNLFNYLVWNNDV